MLIGSHAKVMWCVVVVSLERSKVRAAVGVKREENDAGGGALVDC